MFYVGLCLLIVAFFMVIQIRFDKRSASGGALKVTGYKNGEVIYVEIVNDFAVRAGSKNAVTYDKFIIEEIK